MKLWQDKSGLDKRVEAFTVGEDYLLDQKLVKYDCLASIAHAHMLGEIGILTEKEVAALVEALNEIIRLDQKGRFPILPEQEDCHTAIENYLTEKLGETGKKIHTARSRNDQVLTALRLYYKDELDEVAAGVRKLIEALAAFSHRYGAVEMPGYTHTRKAMPSSVALWSGAFVEAMEDNLKLIGWARELIDQSPLGSGAGYGVPLEIKREYTARLLGFARVQENPLYVQNSRGKFEATLLHALGQILLDLNKISADVILFSMPEIGYFELPDAICTGSSIMPHKKNPDLLEILRSKYHGFTAAEFEIKHLAANLISGYHRDLQATKKAVMQSFEITRQSLEVARLLFEHLQVNAEKCRAAMTEELYSVQLALEYVKSGMSFRDAYRKVAEKMRKKT